ncbi:MAG: DnaJ domain-containing protein [Deltaproteobacteria bacterium]|nr:DnaJ domain-containing protein [Deltaproteobacteria bacterium]MBW2070612.1 DnaJ domain-containing protein [Deltaproteobacteria bacterium]
MKNYYNILGLSQECSEEEIRKAYRKLALKYHPDRNPGDAAAEERFKEVSEAYGVLIDPDKRHHYDRWLRSGAGQTYRAEGFPFTREQVFQDLCRDPRINAAFRELFREFDRAGVRFDRNFLDQVFFGGRGILLGGVFVWGPHGVGRRGSGHSLRKRHLRRHGRPEVASPGFLRRLGRKVGQYFLGGQKRAPRLQQINKAAAKDSFFELRVPAEDALRGGWVKVAIDRGAGREVLRVRIPPGTRPGTRLRLRGKGPGVDPGGGDLYLTINYT